MRRFLTRQSIGYALLTFAAVAFAVMVQWRAVAGRGEQEAGVVVSPPEEFPPAAYECWDGGGVWATDPSTGFDVVRGWCESRPGPIVDLSQVGSK